MLKTIHLLVAFYCCLFLISRDLFSENDDVVSEITYSGTGVETVTSSKNGEVLITSSLDIDENQYDLTFDLSLLDEEDGRLISGVDVHFAHINDKVLIYLQDPNDNYTPLSLLGNS